MNKKILVVGGGPAGSSAGIFLRKAGFQVDLFERGDENRDKICGDGLTPGALKFLDRLGVLEKVKSQALEVPSLTFFDLDGNPIKFENKCLTLKRSILDKILRDELESLGGRIYYNTAIKKVQVLKNGVVLEDSDGKTYEGDMVVLATGAENSLAKGLGLGSVNKYSIILMRGYTKNTIGCNSLDFYFHKDYFPNGAWVFPMSNNTLNIGVGAPNNDSYMSKNIEELMDRFLKLLNKKYQGSLEPLNSAHKWIINSGLKSSKSYSDRVLLCGENISSTHDFSGEGIAPSLKTGLYAANTIIKANGDYSKESLSSYKDMVEKGVGPEHRIYKIMCWIITKKAGSRLTCWALRRFRRAKKLVEGVINETVPLEKGFISAIFYSRKL
jgi:geranylgeranyl reductase family protein